MSSESSSLDSSNEKSKLSTDQKFNTIIDSTLLMHVLDLLCTLIKRTDKNSQPKEFKKIIVLFPQLLNFVHKSDDMYLHLHGTTALKTFIFYGHEEILKVCNP